MLPQQKKKMRLWRWKKKWIEQNKKNKKIGRKELTRKHLLKIRNVESAKIQKKNKIENRKGKRLGIFLLLHWNEINLNNGKKEEDFIILGSPKRYSRFVCIFLSLPFLSCRLIIAKEDYGWRTRMPYNWKC